MWNITLWFTKRNVQIALHRTHLECPHFRDWGLLALALGSFQDSWEGRRGQEGGKRSEGKLYSNVFKQLKWDVLGGGFFDLVVDLYFYLSELLL